MSSGRRHTCTTGGAIASGRHRLRTLLLSLGLIGWGVGLLAAFAGRVVPSLLAIGAGTLALFARRMSGDLDLLWLEIDGSRLRVQLRRQHKEIALPGATVRPLTTAETSHLANLATTAGITAGTGGFDSHLLGEVDLYACRLDTAVLIGLGETSIVVTPDDPVLFLRDLTTSGCVAAVDQAR